MSIKMKIKVTKEILQQAADSFGKNRTTNCAISKAGQVIFPNCATGLAALIPDIKLAISQIPLCENTQDFIRAFDRLNKYEILLMNELEFEVELQDEHINMIGSGNLEEVKAIINSSKTLEVC